jgi:hypothetical protein
LPISCDLWDSPLAQPGQSMDELRELRILVDCTIGGIRVRQLHARWCGCPVCARRRSWRDRRPYIAAVAAREGEPFFVRRVQPLIGPLPPSVQRRPLIVGERLPSQTRAGRRQLRGQLWTRPGVFLSGATQQQARRWALRQARPFGGTVTAVDQHAGGRPHFHIEFPPGAPVPTQRSGHIFYGTPPVGSFFEFDNV